MMHVATSTRWSPTWRQSARVLLAPYLVALALIVFLPAHDAGRVTGILGWAADLLAAWGVPREPAAVVLEVLANVALFAPFGLLLSVAVPSWSPRAIIGLGLVVSIAIELVQLGIPSRFATVSDVIANTAGAAVGCAFAHWWRISRDRRRPATPPRSWNGDIECKLGYEMMSVGHDGQSP